ncbi:MAG: DUF4339 domain-containing protein [Hyphomicrobiaceae bacterium]
MSDAEVIDGWYVSHDDQLDGPLSDADLRRNYEAGRFKAEHFVWRNGMEKWVEARDLPLLSGARAVRREPAVKTEIERRAAERREIKAERSGQKQVARQHRRSQPPARSPSAPSGYGSTESPSETPAAPAPWPGKDITAQLPKELKNVFDKWSKSGDAAKWLKMSKSLPQIAIAAVVLAILFPPLIPFIAIAAWFYLKSRK